MCIPDVNDIVPTAFKCQRCGGTGETTTAIAHIGDCPVQKEFEKRQLRATIREALAAFPWHNYQNSTGGDPWNVYTTNPFSVPPYRFSAAYDELSKRIADYLIEKKLVK